VTILMAHGCAIVTLRDLVREGLAVLQIIRLMLVRPPDNGVIGFCGVEPGFFFEQRRWRLAWSGPAIS
jgi:hypothetical protein